MPKQKIRNHNEWFMPLVKRKCECGQRDIQMFAWGEYSRTGKWRTIEHFCQNCFSERVQKPLREHVGPCGCTVTLVARSGHSIPNWISL